MAVLIKSDGSQHDYPNYTTLEGKQAAVGGLIQPVYLDNKVLLVNEEGLIHQLPLNETASAMAQQILVGDILLLTMEEWNENN